MGFKDCKYIYNIIKKETDNGSLEKGRFNYILIDVYTLIYHMIPNIALQSTELYIAKTIYQFILPYYRTKLNKTGQLHLIFDGLNQFPLEKIGRKHVKRKLSTQTTRQFKNEQIAKLLISMLAMEKSINVILKSRCKDSKEKKFSSSKKNIFIDVMPLHECDFKIAKVLKKLVVTTKRKNKKEKPKKQRVLVITSDSDILITAAMHKIYLKSQLEFSWQQIQRRDVYDLDTLTLRDVVKCLLGGCDYLQPILGCRKISIPERHFQRGELLICDSMSKRVDESVIDLIYKILLYYSGDDDF